MNVIFTRFTISADGCRGPDIPEDVGFAVLAWGEGWGLINAWIDEADPTRWLEVSSELRSS